jgi:hypothetical protein
VHRSATRKTASQNRKLDGFEIAHLEDVGSGLKMTLCWKLSAYIEVTVSVHASDTDESVKNEIRRQLLENEIRRQTSAYT